MVGRVLRFVRLPLLLLVLFTVIRFKLGVTGTPYAPCSNAMFSIIGLTFISNFYFGASSRRVGGFTWGGTLLVGSLSGSLRRSSSSQRPGSALPPVSRIRTSDTGMP